MEAAPNSDARDHYRVDELGDGVVFTITRARRLNAITRPVLDGLAAALDRYEAGPVRFMIVTGSEKRAFCAGTDLAELSGMDSDARDAKNAYARELFYRLSRSPLVSVAAINGLAYGGGLELAMACTLRIAAPHADLCLPEVKLGVLPSYGGTQFLPALIGQARALDMMLTARAVDAREALSIGLVSRIAESPESLQSEALALARSVTRFSRIATAGIRRSVQAASAVVTAQGLALEGQEARVAMDSDDAREGVAAFLEKRAPVFRDR
jgi:enoyl-CoA hydratase